jgi:hypothetical protein
LLKECIAYFWHISNYTKIISFVRFHSASRAVKIDWQRLPTRSYWYQNKLWSLYINIPKRTATQSNPSCRNLLSKLLIYKGKFEKNHSKIGVVGKKSDLRESTKLFQNRATDSDSATQNSLVTDKIPNEQFPTRAQINFDRKRRIRHTVDFLSVQQIMQQK